MPMTASAPVKQKPLFIQLFQEILPDYQLESDNMLDEGVAVLYNTIHIEGANQVCRVGQVITAQLAGQRELEQLHHPIGQFPAYRSKKM